MPLLATNKSKKDPLDLDGKAMDVVIGVFYFALSLAFLLHTGRIIIKQSKLDSFFMFFALTLIFAYFGLIIIDNYLRWNRAEETVSVEDGMLVIDCRGSILRKHKKISMSDIRKIKKLDRFEILRGIVAPDKLRVVYSGMRRYRFGICMDSKKRDELAKKIMDLAEKHITYK